MFKKTVHILICMLAAMALTTGAMAVDLDDITIEGGESPIEIYGDTVNRLYITDLEGNHIAPEGVDIRVEAVSYDELFTYIDVVYDKSGYYLRLELEEDLTIYKDITIKVFIDDENDDQPSTAHIITVKANHMPAQVTEREIHIMNTDVFLPTYVPMYKDTIDLSRAKPAVTFDKALDDTIIHFGTNATFSVELAEIRNFSLYYTEEMPIAVTLAYPGVSFDCIRMLEHPTFQYAGELVIEKADTYMYEYADDKMTLISTRREDGNHYVTTDTLGEYFFTDIKL